MVTLLWDLDGTLIDSMPIIGECLQKTSQFYDVPPMTDSQIQKLIGPELGDILRLMIGLKTDEEVRRAKAVYRGYYAEVMLESPLFPEMAGVLSHFRELGITNLVATAKYQLYAEQIIQSGSAASLLSGVYGSEEDGRLGNKAELLEHIMAQEGLKSAQTIMIGDTRFDMEAARANNLTAIGVLWGYGERSELETAGAHYLVDAPAQLKETVKTALSCGC